MPQVLDTFDNYFCVVNDVFNLLSEKWEMVALITDYSEKDDDGKKIPNEFYAIDTIPSLLFSRRQYANLITFKQKNKITLPAIITLSEHIEDGKNTHYKYAISTEKPFSKLKNEQDNIFGLI